MMVEMVERMGVTEKSRVDIDKLLQRRWVKRYQVCMMR